MNIKPHYSQSRLHMYSKPDKPQTFPIITEQKQIKWGQHYCKRKQVKMHVVELYLCFYL